MALFLNDADHHVTIPDGRGGALIVPAGCEAVMGPEGILVARPHVPEAVVGIDEGPAPDALDQVLDALVESGDLLEVEPDGTDVALPSFDPENPGPHEAPAATKRRRGGSAA